MGISEKRKYDEADDALHGIVAAGRDRKPDGTILQPAVIKKFDPVLADVSVSTWRKKVNDMRLLLSTVHKMYSDSSLGTRSLK